MKTHKDVMSGFGFSSRWFAIGRTPFTKTRVISRTRLAIEALEPRAMLVSEGSVFSVDRVVSTAGLLGTVSAVAQWGDGSQSNLAVGPTPGAGPIRARFDYSLDSTGFFNVPERRNILQAAADIVFSKYSDVLAAITPSGSNTWQAVFPNPATGATQVITGGTIAANEILIYVGARDLPGSEAALGGPGGLGWRGTTAWGQSVTGRGQSGALGTTQSDVGPWGGSMTVDPNIKWHFGTTTQGLDADEYDFLSVVSHEFMHILGFGITRSDVTSSWMRLISNGFFTGANARAANGGQNVQLAGDQQHWLEGTQSNGQEALMDPSINNTGIRKLPTPLDIAGLQDIGWQLIPQQVQISGSTVYGDDGSYPARILVSGASAGELFVDLGSISVANVVPTITTSTSSKSTRVNVPLSITDIATFSDPGFGASETFRYEIDWGDNQPGGSSLSNGIATIDRAGGPSLLTLGSFDGTHTYSATGTYNVTYRVIDDNGGVAQQSFSVQVLAPPEIILTVGALAINEAAGASATSLTIDLVGFDNTSPITLNLSSSDTTEASVVPSVTVLAGTSRVTVPINAIDDSLLDGTQRVSFTAASGTIMTTSAVLEVTDLETIVLSFSTQSVREDAGAGAAILRVSRSNTDLQSPIDVALSSSNASVVLPVTVTIPAGSSFVDVGITVVDDSLVNGTRTANVRGESSQYSASEVLLSINDYEPIQWVALPLTLGEGVGPSSGTIDVRIPAPAPAEGLVVSLSTAVPGQLSFPTTVTIPGGQTTATVSVTVVEDTFAENHQDVLLVASAPGYVPSLTAVRVLDNDRSAWTNPVDIYDVNGQEGVTARDILNVINYINSKGIIQLPPTRDSSELYWVDVSGNGFVEPLDILLVINLLNQRSTN